VTPGSVFVERAEHLCQERGFKQAFIKLYIDCDISLFRSKHLQMAKLAKAGTARRFLEGFTREVCSHHHHVDIEEEEKESVKVLEMP
jgi:hypothetical protein